MYVQRKKCDWKKIFNAMNVLAVFSEKSIAGSFSVIYALNGNNMNLWFKNNICLYLPT